MSAPAGQAWQGITPRTPLPRIPGTAAALGLNHRGVAPNLSGRNKLFVPTPLNPAAAEFNPAPRGGRTRRMRKAKRSKKSKKSKRRY